MSKNRLFASLVVLLQNAIEEIHGIKSDTQSLENGLEIPNMIKFDKFQHNVSFSVFSIALQVPVNEKKKDFYQKVALTLGSYIKQRISTEFPLLQNIVVIGFHVNFFFTGEYLAQIIPNIIEDSWSPYFPTKNETVVIKYPQLDTYKGFHLGHVRNAILGNSLVKLHEFCGYQVTVNNCIGDINIHVAKCLWYYENFSKQDKHSPENCTRVEWLNKMYMKACEELNFSNKKVTDEMCQYELQVKTVLKRLEEKEPVIQKIWEETRQYCIEDFQQIHDWIQCRFNCNFENQEENLHEKKVIVSSGSVLLSDDNLVSCKDNNIGFNKLKSLLAQRIDAQYLMGCKSNWSDDMIQEYTRCVGMASVKYAMLNQDNEKNIIYNVNECISRTGITGVFLLYTHRRTRNILRVNAISKEEDTTNFDLLTLDSERLLLYLLNDFFSVVFKATETHNPQVLCVYLSNLAKSFSYFCEQVPIHHLENVALKVARLRLVESVSCVLKKGLNLLGIETIK